MTPTDLARQLGYPETTVYNWTQKVAYPRLDKIQEIADFFGIYKSNLTEDSEDEMVDNFLKYVESR